MLPTVTRPSVAVFLGQASCQGPACAYGTGLAPLWSGIAFEASPFAAQLPCLAPGQQAGQPGGTSSHPFLRDVSCDMGLRDLSCGHWRPLSRAGAVAALHLPSPSFPPPHLLPDFRDLKTSSWSPRPPPDQQPPAAGPLEAGALRARVKCIPGLSLTVLPVGCSVQTTLLEP